MKNEGMKNEKFIKVRKKIDEWLMTGMIIRKITEVIKSPEDKKTLLYIAGAYKGMAIEVKDLIDSLQYEKENQ